MAERKTITILPTSRSRSVMVRVATIIFCQKGLGWQQN